jgi:DNA-binding LacI/PurR family transcriptional regulator
MKLGRIVDLANQLEQAIRAEQLQPGDAYPPTEEIARRLGVSTSAANGALRVLVKRGILDRRQRRGAVVAQTLGSAMPSALRRVRLLVHQGYLQREGLLADGLLIGIQGELPGAEMQFNFIPPTDGAEYANRFVSEVLRSRDAEGFVLVRAPLAIQRLIHAAGLPAVVFGTLQPSIQGMASIDRDQRQIGELSGRYLLERGCRRVAALFRAEMGPGDFPAMDRLQQVCQSGGLSLGDFTLRTLPADREGIKQCATALLQARGRRRRIGFFCRSQPLAEGVVAAAESLGLTLGRDLEIVISDIYLKAGEHPPELPYLRSLLTSEQIGHQVGRMLLQQARGEPLGREPATIAVALSTPE